MRKNKKAGLLVGLGCCILCGVMAIAGVHAARRADNRSTMSAKQNFDNAGLTESEAESAGTRDEMRDDGGKVYTVWMENCFAFDIADPVKMAENSQYVALVKIDSLDEVDNYSELNQSYTMPYTRGRMSVIENVKGELPVGEELKFYRMGGAITKDKYYEALGEAERERFSYAMEHNAELAEAEKIEVFGWNEVRLEEGKIYLVYMFDETFINGEPGTYGIHGFKGGVREAKFDATKIGLRALVEQAEVLNNFTGEWESFESVARRSKIK